MSGERDITDPELRARRMALTEVIDMIDTAIEELPSDDFSGRAGDVLEALLWELVPLRAATLPPALEQLENLQAKAMVGIKRSMRKRGVRLGTPPPKGGHDVG